MTNDFIKSLSCDNLITAPPSPTMSSTEIVLTSPTSVTDVTSPVTCAANEVPSSTSNSPSCGGKSEYFCCDTSNGHPLQWENVEYHPSVCKRDSQVEENCDLTEPVPECVCDGDGNGFGMDTIISNIYER